jgi:hypothetical protein
MGKLYDTIDSALEVWIRKQKVFFVATAPLSPGGHVNCSPKGGDTFRVLGTHEVAYCDFTGSGIETIAHVQENGRIVIMLCAFEGAPKIVRLHGKAAVLYPGDSEFESLRRHFPEHPGTRAIVKIAVTRISDSCGYSVPRLDFVEHRQVLDKWTNEKSAEELAAYRGKKNRISIDGLRGHKPA